MVAYRRRSTAPFFDWVPDAYRLAAVGLGVSAVGGIGDGIWHTVFGVEIGIDALLSPTHLVLLTGGLLILWTPVRSSAGRGDSRPIVALGTVVLVTSLLVFFIQFLWFTPYTHWAGQPYDALTGRGTATVQMSFGGVVASTAVLLGPLLLIARRWPIPTGAT